MKIKVYYTTMREVEIEVDDKYQRLVDTSECLNSELTAEEWEEVDDLRDEMVFAICTSEQIDDDNFIRFTCAEALSGEMLYEW
jgi:hypothetical protein